MTDSKRVEWKREAEIIENAHVRGGLQSGETFEYTAL